jgi:hypothetical protein
VAASILSHWGQLRNIAGLPFSILPLPRLTVRPKRGDAAHQVESNHAKLIDRTLILTKGASAKMQKQNQRKPRVIDATQMVVTEFGGGIKRGNPKRCLKCHRLVRRGQPWIRHTSAYEPGFGQYSVIEHANCEGGNG